MSIKKGYGLCCGHCGTSLRIRTSEGMSITVRTIFLQCTNELCGATYRGYAEITHQYSESGMANPAFNLPVPDNAMRQQDLQSSRARDDNQADLWD